MTPESENFEQLKKLLALKRHEVPPPGYFNNFSRDVISRIRAGDTAPTVVSVSWFQRLQQILSPRPAFAGAFGLAVCALLVGGILYTARMDDRTAQPNFANNIYPTLPTPATGGSTTAFAGNTGPLPTGINSLTGTAGDPLFNPSLQTAPTPASFRPFGNSGTNSGN